MWQLFSKRFHREQNDYQYLLLKKYPEIVKIFWKVTLERSATTTLHKFNPLPYSSMPMATIFVIAKSNRFCYMLMNKILHVKSK